MKQTQVLKNFLKSWESRLLEAQEEWSKTGSKETRAKVEVLQAVVNENEKFFETFQVVKRPPKKGRKVLVSEDDTKVSNSSITTGNLR